MSMVTSNAADAAVTALSMESYTAWRLQVTVILENLFHPDEIIAEPTLLKDLGADIKEESATLGPVDKVGCPFIYGGVCMGGAHMGEAAANSQVLHRSTNARMWQ